MKKSQLFGVLGLGIFGSTVAKELSLMNQDVIAADINMTSVERVSEFVSRSICLDFTDIEQLRAAGFADCDVVVVGAGEHLEDSVLAIMNLKELGIKKIVAKAKNKKYGKVLMQVGAHEVYVPEKEIGKRLSKKLVSDGIIDLFNIDGEYSIVEIKVIPTWINHSLIELNLRSKFNINVIGIRQNGKMTLNIDPNQKLSENDELLIACKNDIFEHFEDLERVN